MSPVSATRAVSVRIDERTRTAWLEAAGQRPLSAWIREVIAFQLGRPDLATCNPLAEAGRALRAARCKDQP